MSFVTIQLLGGPKDGEVRELSLEDDTAPMNYTLNTLHIGKNDEQIRGTLLYERTNEINHRGEIFYKFEPTLDSKT